MPQPFFGFAAMRAGLAHDTFLEAYKIEKDKINYRDAFLTDDMAKKVE